MNCPRRKELGSDLSMFNLPEKDIWRGDKTCSYCGSLHPEEALRLIEEGIEVDPTTKNYKLYIGRKKFYFQHFSEEQMIKFVDLYNKKKIKFPDIFPGFEVLPFFMKKK